MSEETPGSNKWAPRANFHATAQPRSPGQSRDAPTLTLQQIPGGDLWLHWKTDRWRRAGGHKPRSPQLICEKEQSILSLKQNLII